jgi:cadmium resistance protein CadD (predicted permease)
MQDASFITLLVSTASIAFLHALAPDHWLPFIMIGRAQKWSIKKLIFVTFIAGIGHVGSSVLIGLIGLFIGMELSKLEGLEALRGEVGIWLLIGFGIAYALWGLKHARHPHRHEIVDEKILNRKVVTVWTLFAVFVLGPCEPLIPLFFISLKFQVAGIIGVIVVFSIMTWIMMIAQAVIGYLGIQLVKFETLERYSHTIAGVVIALTGVFILVSGV